MKAYHGTSQENADAIIASGHFRAGTWFAFKREDAEYFGGPVVFEQEFEPSGFNNTDPDSWQFFLRDPLPVVE